MNYIKLTRPDGTPIWISKAFVVTIEPRKGGGSVVVPIGDGLDYDVKENPEIVLSMLQDEPMPSVVPVPPPKGLAPTPEDVSPEDVESQAIEEAQEPEKPAKKVTRRKTKAAKEEADKKVEDAVAKPKRKRRTKTPPMPLDEAQLKRLLSAPPRSLVKLRNALASQFKIADVDEAVSALEANKIFQRDGDKIIWAKNEVK